MAKELGRVHVLTGPGKGKTSSAFGIALRAAGHGLKVCIVQFMKTGETTGEYVAAKQVKGIKIEQFGTGRFVDPKELTDKDRRCAADALARARSSLEEGNCDVVILDEINPAASLGLVDPSEVVRLLKGRREGVEVVLTGRDAPQEFVECADYVSYIDNRKHPFDRGLKARKGIEW